MCCSWLIDLIDFYAVSAIFQPCNGGCAIAWVWKASIMVFGTIMSQIYNHTGTGEATLILFRKCSWYESHWFLPFICDMWQCTTLYPVSNVSQDMTRFLVESKWTSNDDEFKRYFASCKAIECLELLNHGMSLPKNCNGTTCKTMDNLGM